MKRLITLAVAATMIAALAPAGAQARIAGPQEEAGAVLLAGPGPNGETTGGCWTGWARRFWIFSGGAAAGPFGSMFEIDKATWNGKFKLEVVAGAQGSEDLDITFYNNPARSTPKTPPCRAGSSSPAHI